MSFPIYSHMGVHFQSKQRGFPQNRQHRDPHTPSFRDVSLGRNKDMCRNEATTKRTRNFREEKKEQRMLSDGRNEQERKK